MENYKNARDLLKKHLFDKLMCERFGWEIRVGGRLFIVDAALTLKDNKKKIKIVERIIRYLIYELDTYLFKIETNHHYQNIPTIFHLLQMSIEFDDTPIDPDKVYEVDESSLDRKPSMIHDNLNEEIEMGNILGDEFNRFPESVIKACEKLADHDKGAENAC